MVDHLLSSEFFRFKGFHFEKAGLGFELPKSLAVKDIAVRILHTRYDHLSVLARMTPKATHTPTCRSILLFSANKQRPI